MRADPLRGWLVFGLAALALLGWDALTWWWHVAGQGALGIAPHFFVRQDMAILALMSAALVGMAILDALTPRTSIGPRRWWIERPAVMTGLILLALIAARIGRALVFHGYSPSRDELMVEMAGAYLAEGRIGWPVPAEWLPFRHAIVPEFYSPYGSDATWTSIYLPVHAAIRALFQWAGDADLAAPVTLAAGLLILWHLAKRLFPERPDARGVVMVMALTSTQLLATAMTPYAMTSHFAFNLAWLALLLRGGKVGHTGAAIVAILAAGLHQWHFPLLFIAPFLLWLLLRRRWGAAAFHGGVLVVAVLIWARLWPMLLVEIVGPAPPADAHRVNAVVDKAASLVGRLDKWQPLLNIARLAAWNNVLLLPLAMLGWRAVFARGWRLWRDPPVALPLMLGVLGGAAVALYQGYGWGFRYMAGQIGPLCLLAGYGWTRFSGTPARRGGGLIAASALVALVTGALLLASTERYVRPYAAMMAAIRASDAPVVLVDLRGGYFMTDLVRFERGTPGRPVVMALHMLRVPQVAALCRRGAALVDWRDYRRVGVTPVRLLADPYLDARRYAAIGAGCGRLR
jgi:hypothetical protein